MTKYRKSTIRRAVILAIALLGVATIVVSGLAYYILLGANSAPCEFTTEDGAVYVAEWEAWRLDLAQGGATELTGFHGVLLTFEDRDPGNDSLLSATVAVFKGETPSPYAKVLVMSNCVSEFLEIQDAE